MSFSPSPSLAPTLSLSPLVHVLRWIMGSLLLGGGNPKPQTLNRTPSPQGGSQPVEIAKGALPSSDAEAGQEGGGGGEEGGKVHANPQEGQPAGGGRGGEEDRRRRSDEMTELLSQLLSGYEPDGRPAIEGLDEEGGTLARMLLEKMQSARGQSLYPNHSTLKRFT